MSELLSEEERELEVGKLVLEFAMWYHNNRAFANNGLVLASNLKGASKKILAQLRRPMEGLREAILHEICLTCVHKPLKIVEGMFRDNPKGNYPLRAGGRSRWQN